MLTTTNVHVAVHTISFRGKGGAIFILLAASLTLFAVGFATVSWSLKKENSWLPKDNSNREGLWESCQCKKVLQKDWLRAVQAMMCIGLIGLLIALLLITIYLCVHSVSKNSTIIALVCDCFLTVVFMLIGFIIYGVEKGKQKEDVEIYWSFWVAVVASILCFVAGIVSVVQMRESGVRM